MRTSIRINHILQFHTYMTCLLSLVRGNTLHCSLYPLDLLQHSTGTDYKSLSLDWRQLINLILYLMFIAFEKIKYYVYFLNVNTTEYYIQICSCISA